MPHSLRTQNNVRAAYGLAVHDHFRIIMCNLSLYHHLPAPKVLHFSAFMFNYVFLNSNFHRGNLRNTSCFHRDFQGMKTLLFLHMYKNVEFSNITVCLN